MSFTYKTFFNPIFMNVTLALDTEWKLGVIGRNGRGKTTLLKLIEGQLAPDSGEISKTVNTEYFPYIYTGKYTNTIDVIKECIGKLRTLEDALDDPDVLEQYMELDGFAMEGKIKRELKRIGLKENVLQRNFYTLSGGEQTKALLIALFLKRNTFVLLDEPTNHLDLKGREEIASYLNKKKGFIIVSHDQEFLDQTINHVLAINKNDITIEKGNYSTWKRNFDLKEEFELRTKMNLTKEIKKLEGHAEKKREWADVSNTQKYHFVSNSRTNGTQSYMKQAKRAEEKIKQDIKNKQKLLLNFEDKKTLDFFQEDVNDDCLIKVKNLSFSYDETTLLKNVSFTLRKHDILWVQGENGCGKTTLLNLLVNKTELPGIWYNKIITFSMLMQEPVFAKKITGIDFLQNNRTYAAYEESVRLCQIFDISNELLSKPCDTYSNGEKKKLFLAKILSESNNIIILDEPLNYMDIMFREQLEKAIKQVHPTLIFVEHDKKFGMAIATSFLELCMQ